MESHCLEPRRQILSHHTPDAEDETDWKKIVSIFEIETAVKTIIRLAIVLHLTFLNVRFLISMVPIEADNILTDMETGSTNETNNK